MIITDTAGAASHVVMTADEYHHQPRLTRRTLNGIPHLLVTCKVRGRVDVPVYLTHDDATPVKTIEPLEPGGRWANELRVLGTPTPDRVPVSFFPERVLLAA